MGVVRGIKKVLKAKPTVEGAGVHLKRVFGYPHAPEFDPFLLLDDFHSDNPDHYLPGFPWHPHRGIETITYVLHGAVEHGDSLGNRGVIEPGDVQWMTAGSGIIHQEMPKGQNDGTLWGFQLWANLPAARKMMDPRYRDVKGAHIPEVSLENGIVAKVVSGELNGVRGPVRDVVVDPQYLDVSVPAGTRFSYGVKRGYTVFAYVVSGNAYFESERDPFRYDVEGKNYFDFERDCLIVPESLVSFENGDEIAVSAGTAGVRFLLVSGRPIGEPIAWAGPIVMNSKDELRVAFDELRRGTFLKHAGK
jgi:redox-sensitive bicupin YhaK (pirin superfamily)